MRTLTRLAALSAAAAILSLATQANAGYHRWTLCWTGAYGGSICATLPARYTIPGVPRPRPVSGTADFFLTPDRIRALSRYTSTRDMHPGQRATVFAPKRGYLGQRRVREPLG